MTDWKTVVGRHHQAVWQTAYRLLGNQADALDCCQEAFLDAVCLDGREAVLDWPALLRYLATARALDLLRARYRRKSRSVPLIDPSVVVSPGPRPDQQAEASELAERLRAALSRLPTKQAEVFCLRWVEEMTYEQIADRLEVDPNTVGVLLHRARKRLRRLLASADVETKRSG